MSSSAPARPTIRLRPKADAHAIRRGQPWARGDELVLDRRARALPPGTIATLEDAERAPLATVAVAPAARIAARVLDRDPAAPIDGPWIAARLAGAQALREAFYDASFHRLVHAEADGLPGVIVDRYAAAAAVQINAAWAELLEDEIVAALRALPGLEALVVGGSTRARAADGLPPREPRLAFGTLEGPVPVPMNGATYLADLLGGQKTGLFYDQRPNHAFVARLARGRHALDVFSHVGGFALAMLAGGAASALCVDGSEPALDLARRGAELSGVAGRLETRRSDAFEAMANLAAENRRFGAVVCDPPAFAPSREALEAGLRAYERTARLAAPLVEPGGTLTLCSCSHAAGLADFRAASLRGIGRAGRVPRLLRTGFAGPDHPRAPGAERDRLPQGPHLPPPVTAPRILLDACILYPTVMREVLVGAAAAGAYLPLWSPRILEEWRRAALRRSAADGAVAAGEIAALRAAWPGAEVTAPLGAERAHRLPDPDDAHVLAAAIAGEASILCTLNLRDFPARLLAPHGVEPLDPDRLLLRLLGQGAPVAAVAEAVRAKAERLSGEPWEMRRLLKKARLPRLARALG